MQTPNDLSQSRIVLKQDSTLIAVIEMSLSSWLVAGIVPGVERQPLKKLAVDESALLKLLHRWREEAEKAGRRIERTAVAFEAGRDGFWLARWLKARGTLQGGAGRFLDLRLLQLRQHAALCDQALRHLPSSASIPRNF